MTLTKLKATVAVIALSAGTAFADTTMSTDATTKTDAEIKVQTDASKAAEAAEQNIENAASSTAKAVDNAAEATAQTAENAAEAVEETASDAAAATEQAMENTAEAAEEATRDTAQAIDNAADATAAEAKELTDDVAQEVDEMEKPETETEVTKTMTTTGFEGMVVGDLLGKNVFSSSGDDVGEIDYIVRQGDKIAAVIGIGGFLGLGEYTVAIPLEQFSMMPGEEEGLKLSTWTEEELKAQPEFDETGVEGLEDNVPLDTAL